MGTADIQPMSLPGIEVLSTHPETSEQIGRLQRIGSISLAATEGAALGPFRQLKEIGGEVKQAVSDYRTISDLVRDEEVETSNADSETNDTQAKLRDRLGFRALKLWYLLPFPAYQLADDSITYPLFLAAQDRLNTGAGYGIAAGATVAIAAGMGLGQRIAEKKKAALMHVDTVEDDSEIVAPLMDASINSAPWQVARKANEPREDGESVRLVGRGRIMAYAGSYAVVNTGLYTIAEKLPVNEWVGFAGMLAGMWSVQGAYKSAREQSMAISEETQL